MRHTGDRRAPHLQRSPHTLGGHSGQCHPPSSDAGRLSMSAFQPSGIWGRRARRNRGLVIGLASVIVARSSYTPAGYQHSGRTTHKECRRAPSFLPSRQGAHTSDRLVRLDRRCDKLVFPLLDESVPSRHTWRNDVGETLVGSRSHSRRPRSQRAWLSPSRARSDRR